MSTIYEISLPFKDNYWHADTKEKAFEMANDLLKDFDCVSVVEIEDGKTYCCLKTFYKD